MKRFKIFFKQIIILMKNLGKELVILVNLIKSYIKWIFLNKLLKKIYTFFFIAKDFIDKLLVIDPDSRLNANQALAHPWLTVSSNFNSRKGAIETG